MQLMGLMIAVGLASAQPATPAADQIDFFVGEWSLHDPSGESIGRSQIEAQVAGTMLFELRTVGGQPAQPLWFENAERHGGWTQLFVGPAGMTREFVPQSEPGAWPMVMGGEFILRDGTPARFRMSISKSSEDEVRRLLEMSRDAGATWNPVFDYVYRRIAD